MYLNNVRYTRPQIPEVLDHGLLDNSALFEYLETAAYLII